MPIKLNNSGITFLIISSLSICKFDVHINVNFIFAITYFWYIMILLSARYLIILFDGNMIIILYFTDSLLLFAVRMRQHEHTSISTNYIT